MISTTGISNFSHGSFLPRERSLELTTKVDRNREDDNRFSHSDKLTPLYKRKIILLIKKSYGIKADLESFQLPVTSIGNVHDD